MTEWWEFAQRHWAAMAGASAFVSVLLVVASALALPWFIARMPADYFCRILSERKAAPARPSQVALRVAKNLVGGILGLAALAMLFLPGQGLITLLVALTLVDFPGKRRLERWLMSQAKIRSALNWLRQRSGKTPFEWDGVE
jgi:hypothetical protein